MTREEAIKVLSSYDVNGVWADVDGKPYNAEEQAEAFDMAIEALQTPPISQRSMYQAGYRQAQEDRPRGEWIDKEELIDAINDAQFVYDGNEGEHKEYDITELVRVIFKDIISNLSSADMRGDNK